MNSGLSPSSNSNTPFTDLTAFNFKEPKIVFTFCCIAYADIHRTGGGLSVCHCNQSNS